MAESKSTKAAPVRVLPSDILSLEQQHNLTRVEAERVANGESVDTVKGERTVYRARYEALEVDPAFHPLAAADVATEQREADAAASAKVAGPDPALPQSGPYGPNADYQSVEVPKDKDHVSAAAVVEVK